MEQTRTEVNEREQAKAQLRANASKVDRYRINANLTVSQFVARYPKYLGSPKTYTDRLLGGDLEELGSKLATWGSKLQALVELIEGRASSLTEFYDSMPFAREMDQIYDRLQGQRSDRRCAVALALTGCGKSSWGTRVAAMNPKSVKYFQCAPTWRDSQSQIVNGLGFAMGCTVDERANLAKRFNTLVEHLKLSPSTLVLDDAHEGGIALLKLVKYLIDQTGSRFILLAYPTLWRRMMTQSDDARAESLQLFGRMLKPVFDTYANGITREDVVVYLRQAAGLNDEAEIVAGEILPSVRKNGNLRLLADAVEAAQLQADVLNKPLTGAVVIERVAGLCPVNGQNKGGINEAR